jgi:lipoprotein-releasing system ATP-binding protein
MTCANLAKGQTAVPLLKASAVHKSFYHPVPVQILKGVDLEVFPGESIAIMGRSGEGKSTLLQILGTLEMPCKGTLEIDGQLVSQFNKSRIRNQNLAFVFQAFHLLEDYTAIENVLMPARIARRAVHPYSEAYRRACFLLEQVGLGERLHFHTKLLSGGEKQRVAIARALCNDPELILADEPSGNLDRQTARQIHELLLRFSQMEGKALLLVTHDAELAACCSHRYHLSDGRLEKLP